ncbi:hypothetical protein BPLS_P4134 [Bathymodiolus platifrons methanotrophic gill symbiont]|uniref:TIGR04255 family protein n=1 Tax=Bathymodiolus platifrons methanotrophic gill symbiont TaxID=113268 RepID=UPI0011CA4D8D|nr:TIGR04255 family protein [Bathymodiolus platifrons methanotrophic gill symbiont]TXL21935.1 hypothetical protein BMR03_11080 [Methylococcaceae bacterium HT2]GFO76389.1 hypothetical protein BPLS_P4134 [Bathymodiolus platifrons methanotrophic gill symbiont]
MNTTAEELSFLPINGAHAIVEMALFVSFTPAFSLNTIKKLVLLGDDLKNSLPKANHVNRFELKIEDDQHTSFSDKVLGGIELQKINEDGSIGWMLRASENSISVHCLNYTLWASVFAEAFNYLKVAFKRLEGSDSLISSVGIMYVDRFVCNKDPSTSNLSELFQEESDWVFKGAFNSKNKLWHNHIGWYEDLGHMSCLNQLKTSASYVNINNNQKLVVTVDHSAIISGESNDFKEDGGSCEKLEEIMNKLHGMNKKVLGRLLTEQVSARINLGGL